MSFVNPAALASDPVMKPVLAALVALSLTAPLSIAPAQAAVKIQEVTSESGVTAWLVEDYSVPIVAVNFAFKGGSTQDPVGKEGLAELMSGLFDEGAGDLPRAAFQEALDLSGAEMSFNVSPDAFFGSLRTLAEDREEAFRLLQLAVNQPRFDADPLTRIRAQMIAGIEARANDPDQAASIAWANAIYGNHPYARRGEGTPETLASISADDLRVMHGALFARENLVVGVVGAIDAETLRSELDRVFGALPEKPIMRPVGRVEPRLDQYIGVPFPVPQASLRLAYPGVERDDPRFFAAYMMNHVLGGGTFSSRLFDEVREKRGLAYGVGSSLVNRDHSSALVIGTSTRADRAGETLRVIRDVIARMAAEGPTEQELVDAKAYIVGSYAINNLDTSGAIARTLVQLQMDDLGIDYIDRRAELIEAVTLDEVKAVAADLLSAEPAIMILGPDATTESR
jgi:zinc protease